MTDKLEWEGQITAVQPRIRLTRSFDERSHSYLGYSLRVDGYIDGKKGIFWVGIGKAAQAKHQFQAGLTATGKCQPVADANTETVDYYKASALAVIERSEPQVHHGPPWHGIPPALEIYRERGHRRLSAKTYQTHCETCIWGCKMPVTMILDQWNPDKRRYRQETFCYGPKSCQHYSAGPTRKVPGRSGMTWEEEDWVDEDATRHRGPDD